MAYYKNSVVSTRPTYIVQLTAITHGQLRQQIKIDIEWPVRAMMTQETCVAICWQTCFNNQVEQHRGSCWHSNVEIQRSSRCTNWTVKARVQERNDYSSSWAQKSDFRLVLSMEVLKAVYRIIGPASRVLQGESVDS